MLKLAQSRLDLIVTAIIGIDGLATLDPAIKIALFKNNITPGRGHVFADFVLATFTGSDPKAMATDLNAVPYTDPLSGEKVLEIAQPVGGLQFVCTAAPGAPETIYGYILTNAAGNAYWGGERFAAPYVITDAGQGINIGNVEVRLSQDIFVS